MHDMSSRIKDRKKRKR